MAFSSNAVVNLAHLAQKLHCKGPSYTITEQPDGKGQFMCSYNLSQGRTCSCSYEAGVFSGTGSSKKAALQEAAKYAWQHVCNSGVPGLIAPEMFTVMK